MTILPASRACWRRTATLLLLVPLLAGCGLINRPDGINIWNNLTDPVVVVYLKDGETPGGRIEPGVTATFVWDIKRPELPTKEQCTTADIVVRALDGREIGRIPPPACVGSRFQVDRLPVPAPSGSPGASGG